VTATFITTGKYPPAEPGALGCEPLKAAVTFRSNHVHDNVGHGLWCDINCRNVVYEVNLSSATRMPASFTSFRLTQSFATTWSSTTASVTEAGSGVPTFKLRHHRT
jgi:hypothetical protein